MEEFLHVTRRKCHPLHIIIGTQFQQLFVFLRFQLRMFLEERPTRYVFLTSDQSTDYDPTEWEFEICEEDETSCVTFGYAQEPPTERQVQYVPEYVPPRVPSTTPTVLPSRDPSTHVPSKSPSTESPTEPTTLPPIDPDFPGTPNPA